MEHREPCCSLGRLSQVTEGLLPAARILITRSFPYYTDDRIHDSKDQTGSKTILPCRQGNKKYLWEPFSTCYEGIYRIQRNIYKNVFGNKLIYEEVNQDLTSDIQIRLVQQRKVSDLSNA